MPLMQLSALVLPAPFGPISANNWPGSTAKEIPSSTMSPPNLRLRFSTVSSAIPSPRTAVLLDLPVGTAARTALPEVELLDVLMAGEPCAVAVEDDSAV